MKCIYSTSKLLFFSAIVVLTSCYVNLSAQPSTNICTACGSGSYWPLTVGNTWAYEPQSGNSVLSESGGIYVISNNGTMDSAKLVGDNMYYKWQNNVSYSFGAATLFTANTSWIVMIPANPFTGQTWSGPESSTDSSAISTVCTVVSTNATITGSCTYYNCLEITYNHTYTYAGATATALWTNYYMAGLGEVYSTFSANNGIPTIFDLVSTQLYGCNATAIDQVEENTLTLKAYPNPVTNQLTLDCTAFDLQKPLVSVLDAVGKEIVINSEYINNRFELNTARLAPGIYLVLVRINDKVLSQKFVKE
jgi:hypothetical protein